jgi:hypothetical protein
MLSAIAFFPNFGFAPWQHTCKTREGLEKMRALRPMASSHVLMSQKFSRVNVFYTKKQRRRRPSAMF